jgi:DNA primase
MDYEKISFVEAVQELASQLGIDVEPESSNNYYSKEKQSAEASEQEILYDVNTEAAKYFSNNLLNSDEGGIARDYFSKRKVKIQTMRIFGLGYALNGWENFVHYAVQNKIEIEKCIQLGLIGKNAEGKLYDKFSARIIFPVFSPNGRVIAFAGRVFQEKEGTAKYLNSPESMIYIKGKILYGLSHAKDEIRKLDKAILVEGYMDLISLYQAGIKNVVAVSGTALTEDQVQLLSRYTKNVVLLFDADTAGIKASMRSIELLLKKDMEIKIASLPSGEDPDSYVNNYGKEKFEELVSYAGNFLEYQTAYYESQGMFTDAGKTAEAVRELVKPAALINDELKRTLLLKSIAKKFNLREKLLETELEKIISRQYTPLTNEVRSSREIAQKSQVNNENIRKKIRTEIYENEKDIIRLLFEGDREIVEFISAYIEKEEFLVDAHRELAALVYDSNMKNEDILAGSLVEKIGDEKLRTYLLEITFEKYSISKTWEETYPSAEKDKTIIKNSIDAVKKFKTLQVAQKIEVNNKLMETAESEDERRQLVLSNMELEQEKKKIKEINLLNPDER